MIRPVLAIALSLVGLSVAATSALAEVNRYAVIVGNNEGDEDQESLRFAETDAEKVRDVLTELGDFRAEDVVLLRGEDAATVRRTLIALNDRIRSSGADALLFVYYSGHADAEALQLGSSRFEVSEVEQLVRGSPAAVRLLIVDACRSGSLTRVKGGKAAPPFALHLDERLSGEGVVLLTASSANEDAQESDDLKGSFFTHYLVSGLLGAADADGDGFVSLEESYRYAYDSTVRASSRTEAGTQHPTFHYDLRGQGDLALTALRGKRGRRGAIELPDGYGWLVLASSDDGAVVGEVGVHDEARVLSVRPGRYFVRGRSRDQLLEGVVAVDSGKTHQVDVDDLEVSEFARLVRKGGGRRRAHSMELRYLLQSASWQGATGCHGGLAGYGIDLRHVSLGARVYACRSEFTNDVLVATNDELGAELRLAHAFDLPRRVVVETGATLGGAFLHQSFATRGVAPPRTSSSGLFGIEVAFARDLGGPFYLSLLVGVQGHVFRQHSEIDDSNAIGSRVTGRVAFGVGRRW